MSQNLMIELRPKFNEAAHCVNHLILGVIAVKNLNRCRFCLFRSVHEYL